MTKKSNNKLLSIINTFSKVELNRLKKYIKSPYFNKNEDILNLFQQLERIVSSKRDLEFEKEKTWAKIYPSRPYDDARFRKLNSDLLKLVEGFLAQEVYQDNPIHQATYLLEAIAKRKLAKLNNTTLNTAERLSERQVHKPATHYFYQYQIERNKYLLTDFDLKRTDVTNVKDIINNLDYFYLAEKLRYYGETLSRKNIIEHDYELLFIDEIIQHIEKYGYNDIPPVAIYYQMCLAQLHPENEEHFYLLKELLNQYALLFPSKEAEAIYTTAINYCIKKANQGNKKFLIEFLDLNEELLSKGILGEGQLSPWKFKNVVTGALRAGRYDWAEQFIQNYYTKIPESHRDNAFTFNLASLYFYKKEYDKVLEQLRTVENEDFMYSLDSKTYLLLSYYELDEIEPLYFLMDSFRVFLNRQKDLTNDRKKRYLDLIKYIKRLTKIFDKDRKAIDKIKSELSANTAVAGRTWLLEKIAELEK